MNQSTHNLTGSPTFTIKVTKAATKVTATAPSLGISAEGQTTAGAVNALKVKVDAARHTGGLKQIA